MKGLYLNVSSSGISASVGVRGASMTIGKKGSYINYGIPGTGLYNRVKVGGGTNVSSQRSSMAYYTMSISLDESGKPILKAKDENGHIVTDESVLRKLRKGPQYKQRVLQLSNEYFQKIEKSNSSFIEIFRQSPVLLTESDIHFLIDELSVEVFYPADFCEKKPEIGDVENELTKQAKSKFRSLLFWRNKKNRIQFVSERLQSSYNEKLNEYYAKKTAFETKENKKVLTLNLISELEDYKRRESLRKIITGGSQYIEKAIGTELAGITLPVDFSIDYEYCSDNNALLVDLDLPEIEDLPQRKASILASGKVSIKEKGIRERQQDYATCVCGLAFYFASLFFNVSLKIERIIIAAYTQRVSKQTGNLADDYIYSILFDRETFSSLNIREVDPIVAFENFPHVRKLLKSYIFKGLSEKELNSIW